MFRRWHPALLLAVCVVFTPAVHADAEPDKKPEKKEITKPATVPVFRLRGTINEAPTDELLTLFEPGHLSFREIVSRMKKAADDPAVKAVVLLADDAALGMAQIEELGQSIAGLRAAGKDVFAHSDSMSLREYVLLSGATRLSMVPTADLWLTGMVMQSLHVRGLLDLISVKPDFLTCGDYKSAAEMFMRETASPQAEKMMNWLIDGLYDASINQMARGRKVEPSKVKDWINGGPYTAEKAKAAGIIDAVEHRQDFTKGLKEKFGKDVVLTSRYGDKKPPALDLSSPFGMFKMWGDLMAEATKKKSSKPAVGIVYVEGPITLGSSSSSPFGESSGAAMSGDIRKALNEAAEDTSIKAVVLRVNSPGGSAVASEIILDASKRVKAKKPLIVSMGDVAGSGGYYVACGADTIYANEATITGSIGVVAGKLATKQMWGRVGINFQLFKRGEYADMLVNGEPFTPVERERMQGWMDDIYGVFKGHVTAIRGNRLKKPIDDIAGGRVYTGKQALDLGLVDKLGSMQDAVRHVAAEAKLTDYDVRVVPEPKNFIDKLLEETSGGKDPGVGSGTRVAGRDSLLEMALPHLKHLDPARAQMVKRALRQLELLQREGAVLIAPELLVGN